MDFENLATIHMVGAGIWSGVVVFLTGTIGFMAVKRASRER